MSSPDCANPGCAPSSFAPARHRLSTRLALRALAGYFHRVRIVALQVTTGDEPGRTVAGGGPAPDAGQPLPPLAAALPDAGVEDGFEWKLFPVIAYNSDVGFEFGAFAVVTRLGPPCIPYHWSLSGQAALSG